MSETWSQLLKRQDQEKIDLLLSLSHLTVREAAEELGMDPASMREFLRYREIEWPTSGRVGRSRVSKEAKALRVQVAKVGAPEYLISKHFGITRQSFLNWCDQNNVEVAK